MQITLEYTYVEFLHLRTNLLQNPESNNESNNIITDNCRKADAL